MRASLRNNEVVRAAPQAQVFDPHVLFAGVIVSVSGNQSEVTTPWELLLSPVSKQGQASWAGRAHPIILLVCIQSPVILGGCYRHWVWKSLSPTGPLI